MHSAVDTPFISEGLLRMSLEEDFRVSERSFLQPFSLQRSEWGAERVQLKRQCFRKLQSRAYIGVHLDRARNLKQPIKKLRPKLHSVCTGCH